MIHAHNSYTSTPSFADDPYRDAQGKWAKVTPGAHFAGNREQVTKATTPQRESVKTLCGGSIFKEFV